MPLNDYQCKRCQSYFESMSSEGVVFCPYCKEGLALKLPPRTAPPVVHGFNSKNRYGR